MGLLYIARPNLIVAQGSSAADIYHEALAMGGAAGHAMRARVLSNLLELLRCGRREGGAGQGGRGRAHGPR
jgi:hypothetical protein